MAAYAALLSLMHTVQQIQQHPRPPISLDEEQVHSLTENVTFLQNFLEGYSSRCSEEEDELESRIARAAYAAEDVIETHIVDQIHARSITDHGENMISSLYLYQDLQRVIQDMVLQLRKEVETIKEKMGVPDHQLHRNSSVSTASVRPASTGQNNTMVDFDDVLLIEVLDKLTGQQCGLQIIPIVGMGGIGKTTFARNIYTNPLIVHHFDILAWATISQQYSKREILLQVLPQEIKENKNDFSRMSEDQIGERVHKTLCGRRYLIVMDDIWSIEAWDEVKFFFPDNNNGSRIMITTRLSNLAFQLSGSYDFQMNFFDEDKSWNLLCDVVFGKEGCPSELENTGKEIAKNCRGLPLSIVVIGGLLKKSNMTRTYWEYTLENLNSLLNLENDEYCLQILRTSYKELPIHLKPCFLYIGIFPEDNEIRVSKLIKLWVAEGILKSINDKTLEEVAEEYVKQLIDRNLIFVHKSRWNRKAKLCKIHDLVRNLCLREAQKQKFLCVLRQQDLHNPRGINIGRRICIQEKRLVGYSDEFLHAFESASHTRSLLLMGGSSEPEFSLSSTMLRVYSWAYKSSGFRKRITPIKATFQKVNLRYFSVEADQLFIFPSSWSFLWNLQTLEFVFRAHEPIIAPSDIWKMPHLRHIMLSGLELPDPPYGKDDFVLENLHTLSGIWNFKCSEEVVKKIPNIKKLKLYYDPDRLEEEGLPNFCLNNLGQLQNLESLEFNIGFDAISDREIFRSHLAENLTFPHSLKNLTLRGTRLFWEELTTKIGSLPLLEVLKLKLGSCRGPEWETVEGQFCSLKFLLIEWSDLEFWTTDSTHFSHLEHLVLQFVRYLEEIPSSIGDIPMLQSIQLEYCSKSAAESAKRIKQEQEDLGNVDLQVQIGPSW